MGIFGACHLRFIFCFVAAFSLASAHAKDTDLDNLTLEDLLNTQKVTVASQKATSTRLSPGIVTVITANEIKEMGARDLIDVLSMVPGFQFAGEIYSIDGLGVRGFYVNEGRALVMIDGIMVNETLYGNIPLFNRYPVDQIAKIEIIRGPGSAIYGGFAALAVINITTKGSLRKNICGTDILYSRMTQEKGRDNLSAYCARNSGSFKWDAAVQSAQGNRSNGVITNYDTTTNPATQYPIDTKNANREESLYLNAGLGLGNFNIRFLVDRYEVSMRTGYGTENIPSPVSAHWDSYNMLASYDFKLNKKATINLSHSYKYDTPWRLTDDRMIPIGSYFYFDVENHRQVTSLKSSIDMSRDLNLLVGAELLRDHAYLTNPTPPFKSGSASEAFSSYALYAQGLYGNDHLNLAVGARFEDHSAFDPAFVPRVALTGISGPQHLKLLYSKAYRNPSIYNINSFDQANYTLKPEQTTAIELEYGRQISPNLSLTGNIFDVQIDDPIIYISASDTYITFPKVANQGAEIEGRVRGGWGFSTLSYSYYRVRTNDVTSYKVNADDNALLAFPQHKMAGLVSLRMNKTLSLNPSFLLLGRSWTNSYDRSSNSYTEKEVDMKYLLNVNVSAKNVGLKGLDASLGVYNILNQTNNLIMAYRSEHEDVPGPSRDIGIRLDYRTGF